jgi:hypothetical protein
MLYMAELVAKLSYNAALPSDEFDEDTAAWVAHHLRGFARHIGDDAAFMDMAWKALARPG